MSTAEMATVNVELQVGDVGQSIEVVSNAEMVSSNSATVVRTLDRVELESLPTSARNFTQLLVIEPGVSADISELLSNDNASISPSVNGARTTNNSFVFNGVDVTNLLCCNSRINGRQGEPSTRAEAPAFAQRGAGPRDLGRSQAPDQPLRCGHRDATEAATSSWSPESGTNEFHGSVYHFFQNDALIANDFFFNRAGLERPLLRRNEGGFTVGGPIIRNRTFFFGSYQITRARTSFVDEASNTRRAAEGPHR